MSAAFKFNDQLYWGTNGAIEAYLEVLCAEATTRFGFDAPMSEFFCLERASFNMGKVIFLNQILTDVNSCDRFLELLDAATEQLIDVFTDYGREWILTTMQQLRTNIKEAN